MLIGLASAKFNGARGTIVSGCHEGLWGVGRSFPHDDTLGQHGNYMAKKVLSSRLGSTMVILGGSNPEFGITILKRKNQHNPRLYFGLSMLKPKNNKTPNTILYFAISSH